MHAFLWHFLFYIYMCYSARPKTREMQGWQRNKQHQKIIWLTKWHQKSIRRAKYHQNTRLTKQTSKYLSLKSVCINILMVGLTRTHSDPDHSNPFWPVTPTRLDLKIIFSLSWNFFLYKSIQSVGYEQLNMGIILKIRSQIKQENKICNT